MKVERSYVCYRHVLMAVYNK